MAQAAEFPAYRYIFYDLMSLNPDPPITMSDPIPYSVGQTVTLSQRLPYLKTADPMPMLRPGDLIASSETGTILERRPGGWAVKFARGVFLMAEKDLAIAPPPDNP